MRFCKFQFCNIAEDAGTLLLFFKGFQKEWKNVEASCGIVKGWVLVPLNLSKRSIQHKLLMPCGRRGSWKRTLVCLSHPKFTASSTIFQSFKSIKFGLGKVSEQACKNLNCTLWLYFERHPIKNANNPKIGENLLKAVVAFNSKQV